jgi:hypothetical protein
MESGVTLKIRRFIKKHGEFFAVSREDKTFKAKGLVRGDGQSPYVAFEPGTDIQPGDELRGEVSGNVHHVTRVDTDVVYGRPFQLRAFTQNSSVHQPGGIHIGSMVNSAIQQNSPGAVQTITITKQYRENAAALIAQIKTVLPELNLSDDDLNEVSAELATIDSQLTLSKPRSSVIVDSFNRIKSMLETTAAVGETWGFLRDIVPRITDLLS